MVFKFVALACLVVATKAGFVPSGSLEFGPVRYSQPGRLAYASPIVSKAVIVEPVNNYDSNPEYSFSYEVDDASTGDAKSQRETRKGDVVEGSYSFIEADGTRRVVRYTADEQNGFNAVVEKQPAEIAVKTLAPLKTIAPAKPLAYKVGAIAHPVTIHDRFAPVAYSAPIYHH